MSQNKAWTTCKKWLRSLLPQPLRSILGRIRSTTRLQIEKLRRQKRWRNLQLDAGKSKINKVFIIVVDALRRDALSLYGNSRLTTPFLDSLAHDDKHGCALGNFYAASSWTYPSVVSMLTGWYPHSHGGQSQGKLKDISQGQMPARWDRGIVTIPDVFNQLGWETHFLSSNPWASLAAEGLFKKHVYKPKWGLEDFLVKIENACAASPRAKQFFYYQPMPLHTPVEIPDKYRQIFQKSNPTDPEKVWTFSYDELSRSNPEFREYREARILLYHRTLRWLDEKLKQFVEAIEEISPLENILLVVTADHGEEFWDHLEEKKSNFTLKPDYGPENKVSLIGKESGSRPGPGHGHNLFQDVMHIPCVIHHPDWETGMRNLIKNRLLSQVDLMNLVLKLCHISGDIPENEGLDFNDPDPKHTCVLAEDTCYGYEKKAVVRPPHKLLVSPDDNVCWLYNLAEDPNEKSPSEQQDETVHELIEELPQQDFEPRKLLSADDKVLQRLRSLGYHD